MTKKDEYLTVRLTSDMKTKLIKMAKKEKRTMTNMMMILLEKVIK